VNCVALLLCNGRYYALFLDSHPQLPQPVALPCRLARIYLLVLTHFQTPINQIKSLKPRTRNNNNDDVDAAADFRVA